jgi:hypothetical protein
MADSERPALYPRPERRGFTGKSGKFGPCGPEVRVIVRHKGFAARQVLVSASPSSEHFTFLSVVNRACACKLLDMLGPPKKRDAAKPRPSFEISGEIHSQERLM